MLQVLTNHPGNPLCAQCTYLLALYEHQLTTRVGYRIPGIFYGMYFHGFHG